MPSEMWAPGAREEMLGRGAWLFYWGKIKWHLASLAKVFLIGCEAFGHMCYSHVPSEQQDDMGHLQPPSFSMCTLCRDRGWEQHSSPDKTEGTLASRFLFLPLSQMPLGQRGPSLPVNSHPLASWPNPRALES